MAPNHPSTKSLIFLIIGYLIAFLPSPAMSQSAMSQLVNPFGIEINDPELVGYFSLGETAINTIEGPGGIITQGFLQPEVKAPCSNFELEFYPNPVFNKITIKDAACGKVIESIKVYNIHGKWVSSYQLVNREAILDTFVPGVYLVRAYGKSKEFLGAFKIVKLGDGGDG